ncbi:hypothetical protein QYS49_38650 [Marivirga salinae]|uniref:Uncharacterized protein n=1 Tax=Marivirga salinarum TaxID=3059078 RepID=A0AA51NAM4_9BACT|nr:hypothetical protein [Marivirga sp. BDSF4-3]WMN11514.1 hypothetical protein QYS49_38650 [Marivirga sp. BDSF4-3]
MTRKLTPDYFGWVLLFLIVIVVAIFWLWLGYDALTLEKRYHYDFLGYSIAFLAFILFGFEIFGLWLLIQFLKIEMGRKIIYDGDNERLIIYKNGVTEEFYLNELESLILSESSFYRITTAHLSYSQLNFKSKEPIIFTSFVLTTKEMDKLLGKKARKVDKTIRKFFEGIHIKEIATLIH